MLKDNGAYFTQDEAVDESGFHDLYLDLNAEEIAILAHKSEDMIKKCSINGNKDASNEIKCQELISGAKPLFSPRHGVCYMFNNVHQDQINTSLTADWPGPSTGVELLIDIEGKDDYFPNIQKNSHI